MTLQLVAFGLCGWILPAIVGFTTALPVVLARWLRPQASSMVAGGCLLGPLAFLVGYGTMVAVPAAFLEYDWSSLSNHIAHDAQTTGAFWKIWVIMLAPPLRELWGRWLPETFGPISRFIGEVSGRQNLTQGYDWFLAVGLLCLLANWGWVWYFGRSKESSKARLGWR